MIVEGQQLIICFFAVQSTVNGPFDFVFFVVFSLEFIFKVLKVAPIHSFFPYSILLPRWRVEHIMYPLLSK